MSEKRVVLVKSLKSVGVAYILLFLLGTISAHRFYLDRIKSALCQLFLLSFGCTLNAIGIGLRVAEIANNGTRNFIGISVLGCILMVIWGLWLLTDIFLTAKMTREENEKIEKSFK